MRLTSATVMQRGPARFDMAGQSLPYNLHDTDQSIAAKLVSRLRAFADKRLKESGFDVSAWDCEVYTMDGELPPAERFYVVEFANAKGGKLGVQGILLSRGRPYLDHGLCIEAV